MQLKAYLCIDKFLSSFSLSSRKTQEDEDVRVKK